MDQPEVPIGEPGQAAYERQPVRLLLGPRHPRLSMGGRFQAFRAFTPESSPKHQKTCEEVVCGKRCLCVILQAIWYTIISPVPCRRNIVAAGKGNVRIRLLPLHLPGRVLRTQLNLRGLVIRNGGAGSSVLLMVWAVLGVPAKHFSFSAAQVISESR